MPGLHHWSLYGSWGITKYEHLHTWRRLVPSLVPKVDKSKSACPSEYRCAGNSSRVWGWGTGMVLRPHRSCLNFPGRESKMVVRWRARGAEEGRGWLLETARDCHLREMWLVLEVGATVGQTGLHKPHAKIISADSRNSFLSCISWNLFVSGCVVF